MFEKKYYCLIAGLPDLFFNELKTGTGSAEFRDTISKDLTPGDFGLVKTLYLHHDNKNLLNLLFNTQKPFDENGIFQKNTLENEIEEPDQIPDYMASFISWVKKNEKKELTIETEIKLDELFYNFTTELNNKFLREWFLFELNSKNVLTAFNCSRFSYQTEKQIIRTKANNNVNALLVTGHFKPEYYEDDIPFAHELFRVVESGSEMMEKEKNTDKIKWEFIEEQTCFHYFTIEKILSFILKLQIIERWLQLDNNTGLAFLEQLIVELKTSYEFPAEFSFSK